MGEVTAFLLLNFLLYAGFVASTLTNIPAKEWYAFQHKFI